MTLLDKENVPLLIIDEKTIHPRTKLDIEMKTSTQLLRIQLTYTGTAGSNEQAEKRNTRGMLKTCPSTQLKYLQRVTIWLQESAYNQTTLEYNSSFKLSRKNSYSHTMM